MDKIINIKTGKSTKYQYQDVVYASKEEIYFKWFCDDLLKKGYADKIVHPCETYTLIPPARYYWVNPMRDGDQAVDGNLLQHALYTPDFEIIWNNKGVENLVYVLNEEKMSVLSKKRNPFVAIIPKDFSAYGPVKLKTIVDVKGTFGQHGDAAKFPLLQKLMFLSHGLYVQKIVPKELFAKTFYPERYFWSDGGLKKRSIKN